MEPRQPGLEGGGEGGAGETIRRELLKRCNFLFFDRKEASENPWTKALWIYDLRTDQHFTLKTNPLSPKDLTDFIKVYNPKSLAKRKETDRFKKFTYDEIAARDKANLDIFWLKDESLENLPPPAILAADIGGSLEAALEQFRGVEQELAPGDET